MFRSLLYAGFLPRTFMHHQRSVSARSCAEMRVHPEREVPVRRLTFAATLILFSALLQPRILIGQESAAPPQVDPRIYDIAVAPSPESLRADVQALVDFWTRNTFSDTLSTTRGIGAARRWIKAEFDKISDAC